jgi:DNA helicase-2/ATP-dependent DNA helicase PcrA
MGKRSEQPRLAIAGPGAGKTHTMVDEIVKALPSLRPHQILAAITFTNAAAETIRDRLQKQTGVRGNVFIGTTHTFVNRFILLPCATLFGHIPEDRIFTSIEVSKLHNNKGARNASYYKAIASHKNKLVEKGIVPFDEMFPIARSLLLTKEIRTRITQRISYIFIDEFQDTEIGMLEIVEHFRKCGTTKLFVVGDPEQFVMSFTYQGTRIPTFDKLPFFRFKGQAQGCSLLENHRSNGEIVSFANKFRSDLQQNAIKPNRNESRVLFISSNDLNSIVREFQNRSHNVEVHGTCRVRLYLSEENATYDDVMKEYGIKRTSDFVQRTSSALGDALDLLSTALDKNQRSACADFKLSRLQWRAAGISVLRESIQSDYQVGDLVNFVKNRFRYDVSNSNIEPLKKGLSQLKDRLALGHSATHPEQSASIRRAKGLEADAVLAVAKNQSELKKWLCTDRAQRVADKQDKCRLGYVAFTRPREMLCIACLKPIDAELKNMLKSLEVQIV